MILLLIFKLSFYRVKANGFQIKELPIEPKKIGADIPKQS
jgi:hypothetical protein